MVLFHRMLTVGPSANQVTYNTVVKGYCNLGNLNNALRVVDLMKEHGCKPDEWTYSELICGFCKGGKLELASKTFEEMVLHGLNPNEVTYTAIIDGYCKDGKIDIALSLLEKMDRSGCKPNVQTYNAIINGLSKQNQLAEAQRLSREMVHEKLFPNIVTYTALIDGLCKNGATSLALKIMEEMKERGCSPNLHTYSALLCGLCQEGNIEEAEKMFASLGEKGLVPDHVTYTSMIDGYAMIGRVDLALEFFRQMIGSGCKPNYQTYGVLVKCLLMEHQIMDQKLAALPNSVSSFSYSEKVINNELVSNLLAKLEEFGVELTIDVYRMIASGLCREGRWFEAYQLVSSMIDQKLSPDGEIYNSLLQVLASNLEVDLASEIFDKMTAQGFELHLTGYKALICALCKVGRTSKAQSIFRNMLAQLWNPDEIAWTILIDGLMRGGHQDLYMTFLHIMETNDCKPKVNFCCLFNFLTCISGDGVNCCQVGAKHMKSSCVILIRMFPFCHSRSL
uniref:Uncharacterized protein n=1 Tax=Ananas comosus var. bracteatus TaxID=296719 RepID=A0A6V7Q3R3_ANACO|nr:unnamed protein product [Ananas comosus var. bracteatus]